MHIVESRNLRSVAGGAGGALVAGAFALAVFTACSASAADVSAEPGADAAVSAVEQTASTADVTLEVAAWKGNDAEPAGLPELFSKFETEHPGVAIELTYSPRIDIALEIPRRLSNEDAPDVIMVDKQIAGPLIESGRLRDLGTDSEWFARISPDLRDALAPSNSIHIMPVEVVGMGNFVNLALLTEAGIDEPPVTIDQLTSACRRLADAGIKPMVFTGEFSAGLFLLANGIEGQDSPVAELGRGTESFVDSESFNAGLDSIRDLIGAQCFDPTEQAGLDPWSTGLSLFAEGQMAMMPQGAWNIAAFAQRDDLDFAFVPIPSNSPTGTTIDLFGFGFAIPEGAEHPEAAQTLVDWLARPEHIQVVLEAEAAYTPFDDGSSGTPPQARSFDEARFDDAAIEYPASVGLWSADLESETWASLTAFLLDPTMSNASFFERWDAVVAGNEVER